MSGAAADARELRAELLSSWSAHVGTDVLGRIIVAYDVSSLWLNQEYGRLDEELVALIDRCLDGTPHHFIERRCRLLCCLSLELEWATSPRARDAAVRALSLARELESTELLCTALGCVFRHSYLPGELGVREQLAAECLDIAQRAQSIPATILGYQMTAECACARGDFYVADECHEELRQLAETYFVSSAIAMSLWYEGMRLLSGGQFDEARAAYARAAEASEKARVWEQDNAWVIGTSLCLAMHEDRMGELVEVAKTAATLWPGPGRDVLAYALDAAGQHRAARQIEPVELPQDAARLIGLSWRALTGLQLDDADRLLSSYRALLPYGNEFAAGDSSVFAHGPVAHLLGDIAARMGSIHIAAFHYRKGVAVSRRSGSQYWEAIGLASLDRLAK
jgi:tetratricopeptide (TPR) repeat protein